MILHSLLSGVYNEFAEVLAVEERGPPQRSYMYCNDSKWEYSVTPLVEILYHKENSQQWHNLWKIEKIWYGLFRMHILYLQMSGSGSECFALVVTPFRHFVHTIWWKMGSLVVIHQCFLYKWPKWHQRSNQGQKRAIGPNVLPLTTTSEQR